MSQYLRHAMVLLNGEKQIYATDLTFNETSETSIVRTPGADFLQRSSLRPTATIEFDTVVPASNAVNYRDMLRQGTEVTATWVGGDGRQHVLSPAVINDCNETNPTGEGHVLHVVIGGVVAFAS